MTERPRVVPGTLSIVVPPKALPDRVDRAIVRGAERFELSRARVQRLLGAGHVSVNGEIATDPALIVRAGTRIEVTIAPEEPTSAAPDPTVPFDVVYEDAWLAILDKPAGVVVHPAKGHPTGTLVNGLVARGLTSAGLGSVEDDAVRPGIVHRLDKGTSGLLVVAKDITTQAALKDRFSRHEIDREYVAIVVGRAEERTIETMHGRHPTDRLRFTSRPRGPGKRAVTHVRVLERLVGATLVACMLETGRTHQIRVHLSEVSGTPILGDPLYGSRPTDAAVAGIASELGHQALHARLLGFDHPVLDKHVCWESPPPGDFNLALNALRIRSLPRR